MINRNKTISKAYKAKPERWSCEPALWENAEVVYLNPSAETREKVNAA